MIIAAAAGFLGVVLALVGAELPTDTGFVQALPFWLVVTITTAFLLTTVSTAIDHLADGIEIRPRLKASAVGGATIMLVTLPVALMCLTIEGLLPDADSVFEEPLQIESMSSLLWAWVDQYLNLLPGVAGFWLLIKVLDFAFPKVEETSSQQAIQGQDDDTPGVVNEPSDPPQQQRTSALARRFPEISGLTLLAIEADEHYVRLHTDAGSKHVLYRFRDALKDAEDLAGLRVHRSWWVAEAAMEALEQGPSGIGLRLKGGLQAPVSQTYRRDVERAMEARSTLG